MATWKLAYGEKTEIVVTLASLADTGWREATAVDNSSNLFVDALVGGKVKTGAGSGAGDYIDVYVSGSVDAGTTYGGDCSGTDGAYAGESANLIHLGRISTPVAETTFEFGPWSIADAFGGVLPKNWTLVFDNESDSILDTTGGNHEIHYLGTKHTIA